MTIVQPATRRRRDGPGDHGSQGTPSLLQENDAVELPKGDDRRAIDDLTEAIRLDPANSLAYYHRSQVYEAIGDLGKAEDDKSRFMTILVKKSK
jgi:tetratricopeptide (TPR) repeat protein